MAIWRQSWLLMRSDLRQELRRLELILSASFFTFVLVVIFVLSFGSLPVDRHAMAVPGMIWLSMAFVGALTLHRVFEREREHATFEALLVAPISRLAIYFSKLGVTLFVLGICALVLVPSLALFFEGANRLLSSPGITLCVVALGCLGYAAVGTLFAAALAQHGGKNVLMSVILYPLSMPVLLLALVATRRLLEGHPDAWQAVGQMAALDAGLIAVAALLFESVIVGVSRRQSGVKAGARPVAAASTGSSS